MHFIKRIAVASLDIEAKSGDDAIELAKARASELVWHDDDEDDLQVVDVEPLDPPSAVPGAPSASPWCPLPIEDICKEMP
ncbi:hypothetical protein LVJ94_35400 [Pendulispora rubella]|uniref:Pheromone n=1 Tax=Pendulispora rubella TaxID=2741070 RepID=A0ABZ2KYX5_9BACT